MAQYYTLEEAAQILHTTPDKIREMVRQGKLRGFQDKGTLRFRANDIDEMARSLGLGSDPELQLADPSDEKPASASSSKRKQPPTPTVEEDGGKKPAGGRKPTMVKPPVGSDSDVRLVVEDFTLEDEPPASGARSEKKSDKKPAKPDSGLRLLPMDEDSDVKLVPDDEPGTPPSGTSRKNAGSKTPSDSDIRLSIEDDDSDGGYEPQVTEEIDLDAEEMKASESPKKPDQKKPNRPANSGSKLPTTSPFELSEDDVQLAPEEDAPALSSSKKGGPGKKDVGSKKPAAPVNLSLDDDDSEELVLADDSEEIGLGLDASDEAGQSGINLQDPADSGPSLEDGSSDMDLSLDPGDSSSSRSSKSGAGKNKEDASSSEFELALDEGDEQGVDSSSEFELTLDEDSSSSSMEDSDSEFELTLDEDDAGVNLSPIGEEGEEPDIFETNLDVPALDDESGSEAVPLEATEEMEGSSEFELDLDADEGEGDEESGSQVVPLDEDEADEAGETVAKTVNRRAKPKGRALADIEEDEEGTQDEEAESEYDYDEDADEDERPAAAGAGTGPAVPWGPLPVLMLLPTVIVLFIVGLMSYELVRGMWGFQKSTRVSQMIIKPIAEMFGDKLPD